ncbi:MAG: metallophosphoesterase [Bacteroidales bacterium]|nr:metallophosphoesterase [Bacteroidales bacterium]
MKDSGMAAFMIVFFAIIGVAVWYIASRTAWLTGIRPLWCYVGFGAALALSLTAMGTYAAKFTTGIVMHPLTVFFCYLCAVLVILLFVYLLVDLVHLVVPFGKGFFGLCVLALTLCTSVYGFIHAASPKLKKVTIALPHLEKEVTAVQLTDVHLGHFRGKRHLQKLVDMVNSAKPDVVLFTGDFIESWYNCSEEVISPMKQLKAPVFFVDGNHDTYVDADLIKEMCRKVGIRVLENEAVEYAGLQIVGLDYMVADENARDDMHAAKGKETIKSTMPKMGVSSSMPTVVLHHSPMGAKYIEKAGADLYLSGHTHGGQFFPVTLINNRLFEYNRGLYQRGNMAVYVSCGSGTFGLPLRIGTDSEVTVIHLKPKE